MEKVAQKSVRSENAAPRHGLSLRAESQGEAGVDGAAVGSVVVLGLEIGLSARSVPGVTVDGGAVTGGLAGRDIEAVLGEGGSGTVHVNARHVPEDSLSGLGVLELQDIGLVLVGGQLDRDTAAVGVGLEVLGVRAASRAEGVHVANTVRNGPRVDVGVHVVDNGDAGTAALTTDNGGLRESRGEGGQSSSNESLGEHHLERD